MLSAAIMHRRRRMLSRLDLICDHLYCGFNLRDAIRDSLTAYGLQTFTREHFKLFKIQTVALETVKHYLCRKPQTSRETSSKREGRVGVRKAVNSSPGIASSCALRVNTGVSVLTSQQNT